MLLLQHPALGKSYGYAKTIDKLELVDTHSKEGAQSIGEIDFVSSPSTLNPQPSKTSTSPSPSTLALALTPTYLCALPRSRYPLTHSTLLTYSDLNYTSPSLFSHLLHSHHLLYHLFKALSSSWCMRPTSRSVSMRAPKACGRICSR